MGTASKPLRREEADNTQFEFSFVETRIPTQVPRPNRFKFLNIHRGEKIQHLGSRFLSFHRGQSLISWFKFLNNSPSEKIQYFGSSFLTFHRREEISYLGSSFLTYTGRANNQHLGTIF